MPARPRDPLHQFLDIAEAIAACRALRDLFADDFYSTGERTALARIEDELRMALCGLAPDFTVH